MQNAARSLTVGNNEEEEEETAMGEEILEKGAKGYLLQGTRIYFSSNKVDVAPAVRAWKKCVDTAQPTEFGLIFVAQKNLGLAFIEHENIENARPHLLAAIRVVLDMRKKKATSLQVLLKDSTTLSALEAVLKSLKKCQNNGVEAVLKPLKKCQNNGDGALDSAECYRSTASTLDAFCRVIGRICLKTRVMFCRDCLGVFALQEGDGKPKGLQAAAGLWYCLSCTQAFSQKETTLNDGTACADCGITTARVFLDGDGEYYCQSCIDTYAAVSTGTKPKVRYTKQELLALGIPYQPVADTAQSHDHQLGADTVESIEKAFKHGPNDDEDAANGLVVKKTMYTKLKLLKLRPKAPDKNANSQPETNKTSGKGTEIADNVLTEPVGKNETEKTTYTKTELIQLQEETEVKTTDTQAELAETREVLGVPQSLTEPVGKSETEKTMYTKAELIKIQGDIEVKTTDTQAELVETQEDRGVPQRSEEHHHHHS